MAGQVQVFPSFSSIVQYVAMQRETNNNTRKTPLGAVRCLFGVPDPNDTKIKLEEELKKQRESFFSRWECEVDIDKVDTPVNVTEICKKRRLEDIENEGENPAKRLMATDEKLSGVCKEEILHRTPRRVLQPRNGPQSHLTDYWSSKKTTCDDRLGQKHPKYPTQHLKQDLI